MFVEIVRVVARWLIGGVLLAAGLMKWTDPWYFGWIVSRYPLVPKSLSVVLGGWLIWVEICVGVALVAWPRVRQGAWTISSLLFALFATAIVLALFERRSIPCGCFGLSALRMVHWGHALGDLALALFCAWMARADSAPDRRDPR